MGLFLPKLNELKIFNLIILEVPRTARKSGFEIWHNSLVASRPDLNTRSKHGLRAILQNYAIKFAAQRDSDKSFRFEVKPFFANAVLRDSNFRCCQFTVVFLNYLIAYRKETKD